jgi:hypothetical protein
MKNRYSGINMLCLNKLFHHFLNRIASERNITPIGLNETLARNLTKQYGHCIGMLPCADRNRTVQASHRGRPRERKSGMGRAVLLSCLVCVAIKFTTLAHKRTLKIRFQQMYLSIRPHQIQLLTRYYHRLVSGTYLLIPDYRGGHDVYYIIRCTSSKTQPRP